MATLPAVPAVDARAGRRRRYALGYAVLMYAVTLVYFAQAVSAGQFLSGGYDALSWHRYAATGTDVVLFFTLLFAGLLRWHGKGRLWPFLATLGLLVANQAQNAAGAARLVSLHIPLGVAMLTAAVVICLRVHQAGEPREPRDREAAS
ncbi:hypothetical protein [Streptomyces triticirhizae]|uniref:hypothetical protein n=1 Tax=Streptomyces triticirhizae TaxID=2483353 RepID=UPI0018F49FDF|nr:hypothetical protein [Streptomyces triticirhizae]